MKLADLIPNEKNPRKASDAKLEQLRKAIHKFGDLSGIVWNTQTKHLIGGHQRQKVMEGISKITITHKLKKPSRTGTVAVGYVDIKGERFHYREVAWDENTEKAASIAANKSAGEWDLPKLGEWMRELGSFDNDFDMELTMFDQDELLGFQKKEKTKSASKGVTKHVHTCPKCKHQFTSGGKE